MTKTPSAIIRELIWSHRNHACTCSFRPRFVCQVHGPTAVERLLIAEAIANRLEAEEQQRVTA